MIFDRLSFCAQLPKTGRLAGIDVGAKTLGLALSDLLRSIASADRTIQRTAFAKDISAICDYFKDNQICAAVIGWPLNMNGIEGQQCEYVRKFADTLSQQSDMPLLLWDERLSSQAMDRMLIQSGVRRDKRKKVIDGLAAAYILQGALDSLRQQRLA
ncbi:MAG: Holliday junction resolvase RuvX [Holosporales bacterium]|jgi:putative Holliday junction resolvase|nr:Holliday junction resolvase RuvX [Holosporales bacterium]